MADVPAMADVPVTAEARPQAVEAWLGTAVV